MKSIVFYVNKVKYIEGTENADISFIPALNRRRMSQIDKVTAAILNKCITKETENIVFASQKGETERLFKIIEQYSTENEISPAVFSGSVHNFAVSSYLMNKQKALQYTAIAAGDDTVISGIISAVISKYNENLFVFSDIENNNYVSFCLNISKNKKENSPKYIIKRKDNKNFTNIAKDFANFFLSEEKSINSKSYTIERVNND